MRCQSRHVRISLFCTLFVSLSRHVECPQLTARLRERTVGRKATINLIRSCKQMNAPHGETKCHTQDKKHPELKIQALHGEKLIAFSVTDANLNLYPAVSTILVQTTPDLYRRDLRYIPDLCCTAQNPRHDITPSHFCAKEPTSLVHRHAKRNVAAERVCCDLDWVSRTQPSGEL